ncbi:MAG TPA: TlpA disulfide reductase family protein [Planctomycetota bacterium]|nr:TlpA disulfide reductase family protein [Planctomycetota bacterium]
MAAAHELVGTPLGSLAGLQWLTADGKAPDLAQNRLTLLRWWTVDCPFCRASLPDLSALAAEFAPRGLRLVAVFHPKGIDEFTDAALRGYLQELAVDAVLARDDRWLALERLRARGRLDEATSISVLVDQQGIVRWVHKGPRLHRDGSGEFASADADFAALRACVDRLLPPSAGGKTNR